MYRINRGEIHQTEISAGRAGIRMDRARLSRLYRFEGGIFTQRYFPDVFIIKIYDYRTLFK